MTNSQPAKKGVQNTCIFQLACSSMMLRRTTHHFLPNQQEFLSFFLWGGTQRTKVENFW